MPEATILVQDITEKHGEKDNKPWTRWAIKDAGGQYYSTFAREIIEPAFALKGKKAFVEFEEKGQYKNLTHVSGGQEQPAIAAVKEDGSPDWDVKSLRIERCAFWKEILGPAMSAGLSHFTRSTEGWDESQLAGFVARYGKVLRQVAEADIYSDKTPATNDDWIPF